MLAPAPVIVSDGKVGGKTSSQAAILHGAYQETWAELLILCDEVKHGMVGEYLVSWSTTRINVSLSITRYK